MSDDSGNHGCGSLLVFLLLLVPLPVTLSYVNWLAGNKVIQIIIVVVLLILLSGFALILGQKGEMLNKLTGIFAFSINLTVLFGVIYFGVYLADPLSFRVTEDFGKSVSLEEINVLEQAVDKTLNESFYANLLLANHEAIFNCLNKELKVDDDYENLRTCSCELTNGYYFSYSEFTKYQKGTASNPVATPMVHRDITIGSRSSDETTFKINEIFFFVPHPDKQQNLGSGILEAPNVYELRKIFLEYRNSLSDNRDMLISKLKDAILENDHLNMGHFIFYSVSLVTTIGNNDISPNTALSRFLVSLQAIISVMFFAGAIGFLWPDLKVILSAANIHQPKD